MDPLLRRISSFLELNEASLERLDTLFRHRKSVNRHFHFVREGDHADEVFVLLDGWAAKYKLGEDGGREIVAFALPGDIFPLQPPQGTIDHAIVALTRCKVASASADDFRNVALEDGRLGSALWSLAMIDKAVLRDWLVNVGHRPAYSRIAHLLCELTVRLRLSGDGGETEFKFPLTQEEIAQAQGLTSVHTNRVLQQLRKDGLIELRQKRLVLLDEEQLRKAAEFNSDYLTTV